jgi:hypothetical protein
MHAADAATLIKAHAQVKTPSRGSFQLVTGVAENRLVGWNLDARHVTAEEASVRVPGDSVDDANQILDFRFDCLAVVLVLKQRDLIRNRRIDGAAHDALEDVSLGLHDPTLVALVSDGPSRLEARALPIFEVFSQCGRPSAAQ